MWLISVASGDRQASVKIDLITYSLNVETALTLEPNWTTPTRWEAEIELLDPETDIAVFFVDDNDVLRRLRCFLLLYPPELSAYGR